MNAEHLTVALTGLLSGLALIVAIGAQNAFVLRQGLARDHVALVVTICAISDVILIIAGIAGVGAVVERHPTALMVLTVVGAAYLAWFGIRSLLSARRPGVLEVSDARPRGSIVLTTLALTWLNPHVYLDTVLMLGNLGASHGPVGKWWFAAGAGLASIVWFTGLGYAARLASRWFARPRTWQMLDVVIGVIMLGLATMLLLTAL